MMPIVGEYPPALLEDSGFRFAPMLLHGFPRSIMLSSSCNQFRARHR